MTTEPTDPTPDTDDTTDETSAFNRRNMLNALGMVTGVSAITNSASATRQTVDCGKDGRVRTRGCSDESLTGKDWSTGAVTIQACPNGNGGTVTLKATDKLGYDRYAQPQPQPSGGGDEQSPQAQQRQRVVVNQGQTAESGGGNVTQSQTVIVEQEQSVGGGCEGDSHLPEVEVTLRPGEKRTLWYTGGIEFTTNGDERLNIGIAERPG